MRDIIATFLILLTISIGSAYLINHYSKIEVKFNMNNYMLMENISSIKTTTTLTKSELYDILNNNLSYCSYNMDILKMVIEKFQIKTNFSSFLELTSKNKNNIIFSYYKDNIDDIYIDLFYKSDYVNKQRMQIKCQSGNALKLLIK
jgi:hypothetical protein